MARETKYIDLHLHPHGRSFNYLRNSKLENKAEYHPWTGIKSNNKAMERGRRAFSYAQCSFAQCWNGNCAVVFAAIYPFEKGFFSGGGRLDNDAIMFLEKNVDRIPLLGGILNPILERLTGTVFSSESDRRSIKDYFQSLLMRMPGKRIEFLQSSSYDYWTETKKEIDFVASRNGIETDSKLLKRSLKREVYRQEPFETAKGTYIIAKNYQEVQEALERKQLVVILTLEGAHCFGTDTQRTEIFNRIHELKNMDFPVFFITFSHHFNNFLCGHAHSLIKSATLLTNQDEGLQAKFNEIGLAAARLLLSLAPENRKNDALGRRILIDVKHMGVESREQYYNEIILPSLEIHGDKIPVIASHVCYSGIRTFEKLKENYKNKKETDHLFEQRGLNHWNINVCDEDIEVILKTDGLLGICLDERIMGFNKTDKQDGFTLLKINLERMLEALSSNPRLKDEEKSKIWKVLCIGTDFEGYIDPTEKYPTVLQFEVLEKDFKSIVQSFIDGGKSQKYFITKSAEELSRDFCMNNVMGFLKQNFK